MRARVEYPSRRQGIGVKNLVVLVEILCLFGVVFILGYANGQKSPPIGFTGAGSGYAVLDGCNALAADDDKPMTNSTQAKFFTCYGAIMALGQTMAENADFCPPEHVTNGQLTQVAAAYLTDHPAHLDKPYGELIYKAFRQRWPCRGANADAE